MKIEIYIVYYYKMSQDNTNNNSQQDDDLFESFSQYSQRCIICTDWLFKIDEIVTDPNHKWQMVHKDCVFIEESVKSKKRNREDSISNQNNKSKKV
jgi:alpha-D-ribose 1-methylphosphonate 5-phosphate C-P lyase